MASVYLISSTSGDTKFKIDPGTLNGPGGVDRNSDLRLYGMGALEWGEGVDENVYRLTESFACSQKELGDFLPGGSLGNTDYDPFTDPLLPKDEHDLGPGNGITFPLLGQIWYNTFDETLYTFTSGSGWKKLSASGGGNYVSRDGDWMTGILDMGGSYGDSQNKIINVSDPTESLDVVNLRYLDARLGDLGGGGENFVSRDGDWMTGILDMGGSASDTQHKIINLSDPTTSFDAVNLRYLNARLEDLGGGGGGDNYVSRDGDWINGTLDMGGSTSSVVHKIINLKTPTQPLDAVNMQYVEDRIDDINAGNSNFVSRTGDWMSGPLDMGGENGNLFNKIFNLRDPKYPLDAVNLQYLEAELDLRADDYVSRTGDWMSGPLDMGGENGNVFNKIFNLRDPKYPLDAVNLQYLEARLDLIDPGNGTGNYVSRTGDWMSGPLDMGGENGNVFNKIFNLKDPKYPLDAVNLQYLEAQLNLIDPGGGTGNFVSRNGDWMSGDLDMGGENGNVFNKIFNLKDPKYPLDAVNLQYLEAELALIDPGGGTGNFVSRTGDWMSGDLDMGGENGNVFNKIFNLKDPKYPFDAVNLQYLEAELADVVNDSTNALNSHKSDFGLHLTPDQNVLLDGLNLTLLDSAEVNQLIGIHTNERIQDQLDRLSSGGGDSSLDVPGTTMVFYQASAPVGWTQDITKNDSMLRMVSYAGGGSGGVDSAKLNDKVPQHSHTATVTSSGAHTHAIIGNSTVFHNYGTTVVSGVEPDFPKNSVTESGGSHTHSVTVGNNAGSGSWAPKYINVIIARKD